MSRHLIIPAVYLILKNIQGQYCLTRRFNTGYMDGYYSLPAGHLDGGESLVEGMIREAKEEVDITVLPEDMKLVHVSNNLFSDPERIDFFFLCEKWTGELTINEPDKCDVIQWAYIDSLPEKITTTVRTALTQSRLGNNYSEYRGEI